MGTFVAGYTAVWAATVVYIAWMGRRQQKLARQLETLRRQVDSAAVHGQRTGKAA